MQFGSLYSSSPAKYHCILILFCSEDTLSSVKGPFLAFYSGMITFGAQSITCSQDSNQGGSHDSCMQGKCLTHTISMMPSLYLIQEMIQGRQFSNIPSLIILLSQSSYLQKECLKVLISNKRYLFFYFHKSFKGKICVHVYVLLYVII